MPNVSGCAAKDINITLWYSMNNDWLALESKTPSGHKLSYRLE